MNLMELLVKVGVDTGEYDRGMGKLKSGIVGFGKMAATALAAGSAAVVAFGSASVKTGMGFDKSMSQVAATMGKTMAEMENEVGSVNTTFGNFNGTLRDFARFMGKNTAFSAQEAADALNYMALAGYDTQTSMNMLPNVLNLAAAGGFELARASDMVTDTQTAFGISIERTSQMVDEMAKAASTGNTSVEQLGDAFLTVGGLAKNLNGGMVELADGTQKPVDGVQELEIALVAMANAGIKGSEAGTHMRNMLLKLSSPTSEGTKQLEALGVSVFDTEGNMRSLSDVFGDLGGALGNLTQQEKIQALSELFNVRDQASAEALLSAIGNDWNKIGEAILGAQGAAAQMAETQLDNLSGDVVKLKSAFSELQIMISDSATGSLRQFVQFGTEAIQQIQMGLQLGVESNTFQYVIERYIREALEMLSGALPAISKTAGTIITAFAKSLTNNLPTILNTVLSFGETMLDLIFNTIIPNIISGLPSMISEVVSFLGSAVQLISSFLTEQVPVFLEQGMEWIRNLGQGLGEGIPQMLADFLPRLLEFTTGLRETASNLVDVGIEFILNMVQGLANGLPQLIAYVPQIISNIAGLINDNMPKLLSAGVQIIITLVEGLIAALPDLLANMGNIVKAVVDVIQAFNWLALGSQIITWLKNGIQNLFTALPNLINNIKDSMVSKIKTTDWAGLGQFVINTMKNAINALFTAIPNLLKNIATSGFNLFKGIDWSGLGSAVINLIKSGVSALLTAIPTLLQTIGTNAWNAFKNIDWAGVGSAVINGIVAGLSAAAGAVIDFMINLAKSALDAIKNFFGIKSPSKVMRDQVGKMLDYGLADGITDNMGVVLDAMDDLNDATFGGVTVSANPIPTTADIGVGSGYVQNVYIESPKALDPFEVARQTRNANMDMVLALNGVR